MSIFHVDKDLGKTAVCEAKSLSKCPFGNERAHFTNEPAAQAYYEALLAKESSSSKKVPSLAKPRKRKSVTPKKPVPTPAQNTISKPIVKTSANSVKTQPKVTPTKLLDNREKALKKWIDYIPKDKREIFSNIWDKTFKELDLYEKVYGQITNFKPHKYNLTDKDKQLNHLKLLKQALLAVDENEATPWGVLANDGQKPEYKSLKHLSKITVLKKENELIARKIELVDKTVKSRTYKKLNKSFSKNEIVIDRWIAIRSREWSLGWPFKDQICPIVTEDFLMLDF